MGELKVFVDDSNRSRLCLRGDGRGADFSPLVNAALEILAVSPSRLVVDVEGLSAADGAFVSALNDVARRATPAGGSIVVEVPIGALEWIAEAPFDGVRVERTDAPMQARPEPAAPRPTRAEPSPGAPRREGQGFVTSYGDGRPCAEVGCMTTLSRYNNHDRCALHWLSTGGRR